MGQFSSGWKIWSRVALGADESPERGGGAASPTILIQGKRPRIRGQSQTGPTARRRTLKLKSGDHDTTAATNGLLSFSSPTVVRGPWPGSTTVSSGSV